MLENDFAQRHISVTSSIKLIESALDIKLSNEQLRILRYQFQSPILVNACAGSGKTTLFLINALVAIISGKVQPDEILAITFSKKSQLDMQDKYFKYCELLQDVGINISMSKIPYFSTFHALFYHLLLCLPEAFNKRVLDSFAKYRFKLIEYIHYNTEDMISNSEYLDKIFELRDILINTGISMDGLNLRSNKPFLTGMKDVEKDLRKTYGLLFYKDYLSVVSEYEKIKSYHSLIDFNDMKCILLNKLNDPCSLKVFQNVMQRFKLCFIDEFQDIDDVEWTIIKTLLSHNAVRRLFVIGDDDQSIYSFRGCDPTIITNFARIVPASKVFNLSTNYRTGENILQFVIPMIISNKERLDKELNAYRKNQGRVLRFKSEYNGFDVENKFFKYLIYRISLAQKENKKTAVLVRYNVDKMLITDFLANHDYYVDAVNKRFILQNNNIYKIFTQLLRAFWYDDFKMLKKQAIKIGFNAYDKHIDYVLNQNGLKSVQKLSKYLVLAKNMGSRYNHYDNAVQSIYSFVQRQKYESNMASNDSLTNFNSAFFHRVSKLTNVYFNYMINNQFISKDSLQNIKTYLQYEFEHESSIDDFFNNEIKKTRKLLSRKKASLRNLEVLTLHQAKGLEFDDVFIYGLTDKEINDDLLLAAKYLSPDSSYLDFAYFIKMLPYNTCDHLIGMLTSEDKQTLEVISQLKLLETKKEMELFFQTHQPLQKTIQNLFYICINKIKLVEEERRLIYVGITRAKSNLSIYISKNSNPILQELEIKLAKTIKSN